MVSMLGPSLQGPCSKGAVLLGGPKQGPNLESYPHWLLYASISLKGAKVMICHELLQGTGLVDRSVVAC